MLKVLKTNNINKTGHLFNMFYNINNKGLFQEYYTRYDMFRFTHRRIQSVKLLELDRTDLKESTKIRSFAL